MYKWHKEEKPETITDIQRAARFYYLQKMAFGGKVDGQNFGLEEYDRMSDLARSVKGKMIISTGDCPEMRKAFKGLEMQELDIVYTVGEKRKKATELLIKSW
jgi:DNA adenine methylase